MDAYIATMDTVGDAIINFIDPDMNFTGYTKVCVITSTKEFHFHN